jgi:hypothetical protein
MPSPAARSASKGPPSESIWTDRNVKLAAGSGVALAFILGLWMRFDYPLTLPGKPPAPPPVDKGHLRRMDFENPDIYKGYLEQDSIAYHIGNTTPADLTLPFPYEKSEVPQVITPGGAALETGMLRISVRVEKLEIKNRRGTARAEHLVMRIENKTDKPVAYRVDTSLGQSADETCSKKTQLDQNAMAVPARGTVERTECFFHDRMNLQVTRVEAMQVPMLSFYYVSRLFPPHLGASVRTSAGHRPPTGEMCQTIPQQAILIGMEKGKVSWRDVIDYYARHRCETYDFPVGYRAFEKPEQHKLPVSAGTLADEGR